ncbi:MAG: hypothetical protein HYT83_00220 [Candidatus Levybacteria bacterium]|nr:hypothetical protein [Candidatus Levybacteria bacterium]
MNNYIRFISLKLNPFWFFIAFVTIVFVISFIIGGFLYNPKNKSTKTPITKPSPTGQPIPAKEKISSQEKQRIDAWIDKNDLNQYGDPKSTMYTGGTPLFDEATGKTIDRYDYILKKHPDRPWNK